MKMNRGDEARLLRTLKSSFDGADKNAVHFGGRRIAVELAVRLLEKDVAESLGVTNGILAEIKGNTWSGTAEK